MVELTSKKKNTQNQKIFEKNDFNFSIYYPKSFIDSLKGWESMNHKKLHFVY
jgi:hypothetical protein